MSSLLARKVPLKTWGQRKLVDENLENLGTGKLGENLGRKLGDREKTWGQT
jgi:hypothetical protein